VEGELVGAITLYSTSAEPFTEKHAALLEVLAPKIAAAARREVAERPVTADPSADRTTPASPVLRFVR
jgi:GAF domain-containing protein